MFALHEPDTRKPLLAPWLKHWYLFDPFFSIQKSHDCRINPDLDKYLFIYLFILQVNRSHGLQYEVEVKPTICKNNLMATEYQWTLSNSSTNQLVDIPNVDKNSLQQKRLVLKPCTLAVGFYKLEVKVRKIIFWQV